MELLSRCYTQKHCFPVEFLRKNTDGNATWPMIVNHLIWCRQDHGLPLLEKFNPRIEFLRSI